MKKKSPVKTFKKNSPLKNWLLDHPFWWRWLLLLFSLLSLLSGVILLLNPIEALATSALLIGFCLMLGGVANTVAYFSSKGIFGISGWVLAEGVIVVFLSLLVLRNPTLTATTLLFLVGAWFLMVGILRVINAINLARHKFRHWLMTLCFGILLMALGALSFYTPLVNLIAISVFIGIYFVVSAVINLVEFTVAKRFDYTQSKALQKILT